MRVQIAFSAILAGSRLGSIPIVVAQTGEFVATVPAEVVRAGERLQDEWQAARPEGLRLHRSTVWRRSSVKPGGIATPDGTMTSSGDSGWK